MNAADRQTDIAAVRALLEGEVEQRAASGIEDYVRPAQDALQAFERIVGGERRHAPHTAAQRAGRRKRGRLSQIERMAKEIEALARENPAASALDAAERLRALATRGDQ